MPLSHVTKRTDFHIFHARIPIVFVCQSFGKILVRLNIYRIGPIRHFYLNRRISVFIGYNFLLCSLIINPLRNKVVFDSVIIIRTRRSRIRNDSNSVGHPGLLTSLQHGINFFPVIHAFRRIHIFPEQHAAANRNHIPCMIVHRTLDTVRMFRFIQHVRIIYCHDITLMRV